MYAQLPHPNRRRTLRPQSLEESSNDFVGNESAIWYKVGILSPDLATFREGLPPPEETEAAQRVQRCQRGTQGTQNLSADNVRVPFVASPFPGLK